jgi:glycosyltransferase involved in cell wall biosynthesis
MAPDIMLAPLIDDVFNRSKSGVKFFESAMAGAAMVASNLPPYNSVIEDGVTGYLAKSSDLQGWCSALEVLIDHGPHRRQMAAAAKMDVLKYHSWYCQEVRDAWANAVRKVVFSSATA